MKQIKKLLIFMIAVMLLLPVQVKALSGYTPSKAATYAKKYYSTYNTSYSDYNSIGGDCANFVSQCLYAGGLKMDSTWYYKSYSNVTGTWTMAAKLSDYLVSTKGCQKIKKPTASQVEVGDVIAYDWGTGKIGHVAICTDVKDGIPWICAHNSNRYTSNWKLGASTYYVIKLSDTVEPSTVSGKYTTAGNSLSWTAVTGASGYKLERSTSKTGTYTVITDTTSKSYVDKDISYSASYYYKVVPYNSTGTIFEESNIKQIDTPDFVAPSISNISISSQSATITWKAVSYAVNYKVELTDPDGKVSNNTTTDTSYTLKNLAYGTNKCRIYAYDSNGDYTSTGYKTLLIEKECTEHDYDDGEITTQSTCTKAGVYTYTCKECGATKTTTIAATGHTAVTDPLVKATFNQDGKTKGSHCSVCNTVITKQVKIPKIKDVTLSYTSTTYTGKAKKPSVTISVDSSKYYDASKNTITYDTGRKNVGKYNVTVTLGGNYEGSKTLSFTIKPNATSISSLSASSKAFTVKWKKQSTQTTGYQIEYSTSSKFTSPKYVNITKNTTTSKKISSLTKKKKYYVRIRTYKTVDGVNYYSSYSSSKYITTK